MKSCLIFVYENNEKDSIIINHIKDLHYDNEFKYEFDEKLEKENFKIIYSEKSGFGKSTKIKNDAEEKRKKYIYFPLGGEFSKKEVFTRLINIDDEIKNNINKGIIFHLDLFQTNKIELLNEFLFSLLITKVYKHQDYIYLFNVEMDINIEIHYKDFFDKFPLLNVSEKSLYNKSSLRISNEINSDIQIVCNYLKYLKNNKLLDNDLYIPSVSPNWYEQIEQNKIKAEIIELDECQKLIEEYLIKNSKLNYYQICKWLKILSKQLRSFNSINKLTINYLMKNKRMNLKNERFELIKIIIENAKSLIISKEDYLNKENIISYKNLKTPFIFFNDTDPTKYLIISPNEEQIQKIKNINHKINRYREFEQKQFYKEFKNILNLKNRIDKNELNPNGTNDITIKDIFNYYSITADNFYKMLLLLSLIREKIPVIMMGETGCGKTSLIIKLNQLLNNGEVTIKKLNIHFQVNNETIINFINSVKKEAKKDINKDIWIFLDEINACNCLGLISELICRHSCNGEPLPENMVFIAACNPHRKQENKEKEGLKFENMKDLSGFSNLVYKVNELPDCLLNYVINFGSLSDKKDDEKKYIENIIKESIEKKYLEEEDRSKGKIKNKIMSLFINWFSRGNKIDKIEKDINDLDKKKMDEYLNLVKDAIDAVSEAHRFINDKYGDSSVSLREIRRFSLLFEFFTNYLTIKQQNKDKSIYNMFLSLINYLFGESTNLKIYQNSIILSIYLVYYIKITKKNERIQFEKIMNDIFISKFKTSFLDIPEREKKYIIECCQVPLEIAKNDDLLTNIFVSFICINAKIPLFIVGKPGRSKSLSLQLLLKSMKGEDSDDPFFASLPKLITFSYQGSLSSTSQGIQNTFNKARLRIKKNENKEILNNIISLVFIDELGLAEHSPNNPLKIMHSELEYDLHDENEKIAFVGISNWELDRANMNRGIYLSITEPDEQDLIKTAKTIADSINKSISFKFSYRINRLAKIYPEYIDWINEHNIDKRDFHGARDFFNLIKIYVKNLLKENRDDPGENSIERNLAGAKFDARNDFDFKTSVQKALNIYKDKKVSEKYDFLERIKENLLETKSRYLLLFINSPNHEYCIYSLLTKYFPNKKIINFVGSDFIYDENSEEYIYKMVNKIRVQIGKDVILILKNLESVYPSLYNLFNQNFSYIGTKKYTRLCNNNNTFSFINNSFKCIVIVDERRNENQQPPFLNRFEKHIINYEYLLNEEEISVSNDIMALKENLENIVSKNQIKLNYDIVRFFINYTKEEIQGIIYHLKKNTKKSIEDIKNFIYQKIAMVLPQDLIILINYSDYNYILKSGYDKINEYYKNCLHSKFIEFLKIMKKNKNIIYTFSRYYEKLLSYLNNDFLIETKKFGKISKSNIKEIELCSINKENELEKEFENLKNEKNKNKNIIIFKLKSYESETIDYLNSFIKEKETETENNYLKNKIFIFIIYLKRKDENEYEDELYDTISFLDEQFDQIFIDNLNGKNENIANLIESSQKKQLFSKIINLIINDNNEFEFLFSDIKINIKGKIKGLNITNKNYIKCIIENLSKNEYMKKMIQIKLKFMENEDIIEKLFKEKKIRANSIDYISEIYKYYCDQILNNLEIIILECEKNNIFSSFLNISDKNENKTIYDNRYSKIILKDIFDKIDVNNQNKFRDNTFNIILGIKIPGIKPIIEEKIIKYINETSSLSNDYFNYEDELRSENEENNIIDKNKENDLIKELCKELITFLPFKEINIDLVSNDNDEDMKVFLEILFDDYLCIFLVNHEPDLFKETNYDLFYDLLKLIKKMVEVRFENDNNINLLERIARNILWVESNSKYIILILLIYIKLDNIHILNNNNKEIIFNYSNVKLPKQLKIMDKSFYLFIESMITLLLNEKKLFEKIKVEITDIREIYHSADQIVKDLDFSFNELTNQLKNIKSFIDISTIFQIENKYNVKNIKILTDLLMSIFEEKNKLNEEEKKSEKEEENNKNYEGKIITYIKELIGFLRITIGNNKNYPKLINEILYNEYLSISNDKFEEDILRLIIEGDKKDNGGNYLKDSSQIFDKILGLDIDSIENFCDELNQDNKCLEVIENVLKKDKDDESKILLEQILLNIFDSYFLAFFEKMSNIKEDEIDDIFQRNIDKLENIYELEFEKNRNFDNNLLYPNIIKLYSLSYIKIYLYQVIINKYKFKKEWVPIIKGKSINNFRKIIQLYTFKLLNLTLDNYHKFKKTNFLDYGIDYYKNFKDEISKEKDYIFNHCFILKAEKSNDYELICSELTNQFENNIFKETETISQFFNEDKIDVFYTAITNKFFSEIDFYLTYEQLLIFLKNIIKAQKNCSDIFKNLFYLLLDIKSDSIIGKIIQLDGKIHQSNIKDIFAYEIILTSMRFCLLTTYNKSNQNFYYNLINTDYLNIINSSFIPGIETLDVGIPKMDKITFKLKDKKIRNLSQVAYRLLNFIFYSHIFFSDCLGFIHSEDKINLLFDEINENNEIKKMTFIEILKLNWKLLEEALFEENISVIQIFLNLIFDNISELLKNCGEMKNNEQRIKFEENFEQIIKESYKKYQNYSKYYLKENERILGLKKESYKSIILELYSPKEYDEKEYPFLKYFMLTIYSTKENFINEFERIKNKKDYPVISSYIKYINQKNNYINIFENLPKYNDFLNSMIKNYYNKISRNDAKKKILKDEDIYKKKKKNLIIL